MRRRAPSESELERSIAAAYAVFSQQGGLLPHAVVDDLVGLENYRRAMRCPDMEALAAYAEDRLPFDEALRMAMHERQCPVCRADVADLRSVVGQQVAPLIAALPAWSTPFVGREEMRETVGAALAAGSRRLLTLAAPSGTGKTRLTLETAVERSYLFPDGVWYAPLAGIGEEEVAVAEIARAVRLPLQKNGPPREQLREFFADKRALLVLDDLSPESPAARMVADLIDANADLCCLTSAGSPLGVEGEQALRLPPLETLPPEIAPEELLASESVRLFAEHVRAFEPDYPFDEPNIRAAAALCERAAGIPLGIELTAARAREMPPSEILRRMGPPDAPPARPDDSLNHLLEWAYRELSPRTRMFLNRLGVFEGGFFAEQAAEVCEMRDAAELLESLHQKAMVQQSEALGRTRYQLLAPIQNLARRHLDERSVLAERKHMAYFLHYAQERADRLADPRQVEAMEEMTVDLPNLRAGMDRARAAEDWRTAGEYGLALRQFLFLQGSWKECVDRLRVSADAFRRISDATRAEQAQRALAFALAFESRYEEAEAICRALLAEARERGDALALAEARYGLGYAAQYQGRYAESRAHFEEALRGFAAAGERWGTADCRQNLGRLAWMQGDYETAERLLRESLIVQRERGDRYRIATTLAVLGNVAREQGRLDEARHWFEECLTARQELGDLRGIASAINNMGLIWQALGDNARAEYCFDDAARYFERLGDRRYLGQVRAGQGDLALAQDDVPLARRRFEEGLQLLEAVGDAHGVARVLGDLGRVAEREGDRNEAARLYRESVTRQRDLGDAVGAAITLYHWGQMRAAQGETERAVWMLQTALAICAERRRPERAEIEAALQPLKERLGAEQAAALAQRTEVLPPDESVAQILRE